MVGWLSDVNAKFKNIYIFIGYICTIPLKKIIYLLFKHLDNDKVIK